MKTLIICLLLLLFNISLLNGQESQKPFIISPFIGEKLDKIEADYFNIFHAFADFREATFYLNPDSTLRTTIKYTLNNKPNDTIATYKDKSILLKLRNRINEKLIKDIEDKTVQELGLTMENDLLYRGNIYSFIEGKIRLIKEGFSELKDEDIEEEYTPIINYSEIKTVTTYESDTGIILLSTAVGIGAGIGLGILLGPVLMAREDGMLDFRELGGGVIGGIIGSLIGLGVGYIIKIPVGHDIMDPETGRILRENSLLPSGL